MPLQHGKININIKLMIFVIICNFFIFFVIKMFVTFKKNCYYYSIKMLLLLYQY